MHIETSGIAPLRGELDWVTLSPKPFGQLPLPEVVALADEVKIIVHDLSDIQAGLDTLTGLPDGAVIWLHPEWSKARERNLTVLNGITQAVKENPRLRPGTRCTSCTAPTTSTRTATNASSPRRQHGPGVLSFSSPLPGERVG